MEEPISKPPSSDWETIYKDSRYVFEMPSGSFDFALNGEEGPYLELAQSVTMITAWNPNSDERPQDWNEAANLRLRQSLKEAGYEFFPAKGASLPGVTPEWEESGFAVLGWDRELASRWGRTWAQRAVVFLSADASELIFCKTETVVGCGLRRFATQ